jgi:hypothetical protein
VDSRTVTRRDVLATSSALAVASLAGCAAIDDYPNEDVTTGARLWLPIDHPSLEEYDTKTIDGSIATVEYNTNIILYNDVDLEQLLVERTGGHFTKSPARILGTIYVQTSGFGSSLANRATGQVRDRLGTELREEMRAYGIVNVTETETGDSTRREYSGEVPIKDFHSFDGDGLTDLQDSFEDVAGQMYCGFGRRVDEQTARHFEGSSGYNQRARTASNERIQISQTTCLCLYQGDLVVVVGTMPTPTLTHSEKLPSKTSSNSALARCKSAPTVNERCADDCNPDPHTSSPYRTPPLSVVAAV